MSASAKSFALAAAAIATLAAAGIIALRLHRPAVGAFTAQQAQTGRGEYDVNCAACHGRSLAGGAAPALAGAGFLGRWGKRSTRDLHKFISTAMPAGNAGSLGQ